MQKVNFDYIIVICICIKTYIFVVLCIYILCIGACATNDCGFCKTTYAEVCAYFRDFIMKRRGDDKEWLTQLRTKERVDETNRYWIHAEDENLGGRFHSIM